MKCRIKVISFAENINNCAASHKFGVNEKLIRDWSEKHGELQQIPKSKKALQHGTMAFLNLENFLNDWALDCRKNGYVVTRTGIRLRVHKSAENGLLATASNFRASSGWCTGFPIFS